MPRLNYRDAVNNHRVEAMEAVDPIKTTVYLTIEGQPLAQPRPRFRSVKSGRHWIYNPAGQAKTTLARKVSAALGEIGILASTMPLFNTYVDLTITFGVSDMSKDLDNLLKFIMDVLQDANIYEDDRIVLKLRAEKVASQSGFTTLELSAIGGNTGLPIAAAVFL